MSRICLKCGKLVPKYFWYEGKKLNLQRRKYCFECSPLLQHNTRRLEKAIDIKTGKIKICKTCGKEVLQKNRRYTCYACVFKKRKNKVNDKVYKIVGESCNLCGYNKGKLGRQILCFHHINPKDKKFGLTSREVVGYKWETVWQEIQKCLLICANCHQEIHAGIITPEIVEEKYKKCWEKIRDFSSAEEQSAHNRLVAGPIPASPTNLEHS